MFPMINKRETGVNLRRLMDQRGLTVKDVQQYLGFATEQGVYHWLSGRSLPTLDNLYALSHLLQVPMDDIINGTKPISSKLLCDGKDAQSQRVCAYYDKSVERFAA